MISVPEGRLLGSPFINLQLSCLSYGSPATPAFWQGSLSTTHCLGLLLSNKLSHYQALCTFYDGKRHVTRVHSTHSGLLRIGALSHGCLSVRSLGWLVSWFLVRTMGSVWQTNRDQKQLNRWIKRPQRSFPDFPVVRSGSPAWDHGSRPFINLGSSSGSTALLGRSRVHSILIVPSFTVIISISSSWV